MSTNERRQWGRIGGWKLRATHDPAVYTAPGRRAFLARFYRDLPPDLSPAERDRRAEAAKKAYFQELAIKSARTRRRRAAGHGAGGANDPR